VLSATECAFSEKGALYSEERALFSKERAVYFEETTICSEGIKCDTQASFQIAAGAGGE